MLPVMLTVVLVLDQVTCDAVVAYEVESLQ